jgi:hypothetical protein
MKSLILALSMLLVAPTAQAAVSKEEACFITSGRIFFVAVGRDFGGNGPTAYLGMIEQGVSQNDARFIMDLVYFKAADTEPATLASEYYDHCVSEET